ncbi:MAG: Gldg family protein, partial [Bacteroidota bacterium]
LSRQVQSQDEVSQSLLYPFVSLQTVDELLFVDLLEPRLLIESEESTLLRSQFSFESKLVRALRSLNQNRLDQVAVLGPKSALIAEGFNRDSRISGRKYVNASDGSLLELSTSLDAIIVITNSDLPRDELVAIDALASSGVPVVWCVDKFSVTLDSLSDGPYLATTGQLNLEDYLFHYGVKIEPELIQDLSCHTIPQVVGSQGGAAATESLPYPYHLRVVGFDQGSVLNRFVGEMHIPYASPISVRDNQELLKTEPILFSSPNSKTTPSPAILDFGLMTKALE